ncbi:hypothetical protein EUGRSUZ_I02604 [Eucalyptus grandis]|uniref:Uncharacterized protein n=2 Tax=Eucalyptus grandis TaxID=71139 RepID=A0ACC3JJG7_EUCGR|nr:hypothetical protein EUGRSUZ_I02604 [Eucalyptus grandis]
MVGGEIQRNSRIDHSSISESSSSELLSTSSRLFPSSSSSPLLVTASPTLSSEPEPPPPPPKQPSPSTPLEPSLLARVLLNLRLHDLNRSSNALRRDSWLATIRRSDSITSQSYCCFCSASRRSWLAAISIALFSLCSRSIRDMASSAADAAAIRSFSSSFVAAIALRLSIFTIFLSARTSNTSSSRQEHSLSSSSSSASSSSSSTSLLALPALPLTSALPVTDSCDSGESRAFRAFKSTRFRETSSESPNFGKALSPNRAISTRATAARTWREHCWIAETPSSPPPPPTLPPLSSLSSDAHCDAESLIRRRWENRLSKSRRKHAVTKRERGPRSRMWSPERLRLPWRRRSPPWRAGEAFSEIIAKIKAGGWGSSVVNAKERIDCDGISTWF